MSSANPNFPAGESNPARRPDITVDLHAHTFYSHGQAGTTEMYEAARKAGLEVFGFSEHSPRPEGYAYPTDYQPRLEKHLPDYLREVTALKERGVRDGMEVLLGMEVDYCSSREDFARDLVGSQPFDYIIGGLHFQDGWGFDFSAEEWAPLDREERFRVYARYYQDLAAMCRTGLFHIAAHPDLVKIYTVATFNEWLDTGGAMDLVGAALQAILDQGMLMEVSSAGLRKPCSEIYPGPRIMRLAADIGVPISFGSDAHCTNTPAYGFDLLARYAHDFGYRRSWYVTGGTLVPRPFAANRLP